MPSRQQIYALLAAFFVLVILKLLVGGLLGAIILLALVALTVYFIAVAVKDFQTQKQRG
jgi:heme O synthase-like polyprenyltransferase